MKALLLLSLVGCHVTTSSTMSPATAQLKCLDCEEPVAVGQPVRVISSWVGSCSKEGYTAFFSENKDTEQIEWKKTPFSETKECDEHHYKLWVKCSSKCVLRAMDSPETSTVKLIGVYPQNPGPFSFSIEIRRTKEGEPIAKLDATEMFVRAPDDISPFETDRKIDDDSKLANFAGYEYFLDPGTARANEPPGRGTKYQPEKVAQASDNADAERPPRPDRLQRDCKARTPGALVWRPCTQGVQAGDDVRIDVTAWLQNARLPGDVALVEQEADKIVAWTCYRSTFAVPGSQICVRYNVPAGEHALKWQGTGYELAEKLVVGGGS